MAAPPVPAPQAGSAPSPTPAPQNTYGTQNGAPTLDPGASVPTQRQQDAQRPSANGTQEIQPEPAAEPSQKDDPYDVNGDSSTYFQAPKLFDPNDRTAQRSIAPVTTAVYEKPVSYRQASTLTSLQQAELDAVGWISASK
jgi:hypothetical protein